METIMYVAAILAFAPALILMYAVLRKYTYPAVQQPFFSDPTFFWLFVIGMIAGTLLFAVYTYLDWRSMVYMILFAIVECLAMLVILNLKRFAGKSDTVFYGYGLGLGMGLTMAFGTIFFLGKTIMGVDSTSNVDIADMIWLFLIALSYILLLSSAATTVGEGVARYRGIEFCVQAIIVNVVFSLILVAAYNNLDNELIFYACLVVALIVAAVYFYYTMYVKLSGVVRDVLKMEGKKRNDIPK